MKELPDNQKIGKEEGIDLVFFSKMFWGGRNTVIKSIIIFAFIGFLIAIFSKKEYTASATMVPQINNPVGNLGGLSSIASLAGFNLDMNVAGFEISPVLYPKIVNSTSFQLQIMNANYEFSELAKPITLFEYYNEHYKPSLFEIIEKYTIGLPGLIRKNLKKQEKTSKKIESETIALTIEQNELREKLEEKLFIEVNDKEGYLVLVSEFHQPYLSAQIGLEAQKLLQDYITQLKVKKAKAELDFIQERFKEKKEEFEIAQRKLAIFRDENKNIASSIVRTEEEKLENEYQLAFEVYSELAKQLEQARIKVEEDTPVFSVIDEITVPVKKSKPQRFLILITWGVIGILFGLGIIFIRYLLPGFRERWKNLN